MKKWLCFEYQKKSLIVRIIVEVLMYATVLNDHCITGFPIYTLAIMNIVASAFQNIKDGAIQMAMLLAVRAWGVDFDMGLNGLSHLSMLRANDMFTVKARPAFPGCIARLVDTGLINQLFVETIISTLNCSNKHPFLCPAIPVSAGFRWVTMSLMHVVAIVRPFISVVESCHDPAFAIRALLFSDRLVEVRTLQNANSFALLKRFIDGAAEKQRILTSLHGRCKRKSAIVCSFCDKDVPYRYHHRGHSTSAIIAYCGS